MSNAEEFANGTDPWRNPNPPPSPPAAPSDVRVYVDQEGGKHVYWRSHSDNETYFVIRDYPPDGSSVELGRAAPGTTEFYIPPTQ